MNIHFATEPAELGCFLSYPARTAISDLQSFADAMECRVDEPSWEHPPSSINPKRFMRICGTKTLLGTYCNEGLTKYQICPIWNSAAKANSTCRLSSLGSFDPHKPHQSVLLGSSPNNPSSNHSPIRTNLREPFTFEVYSTDCGTLSVAATSTLKVPNLSPPRHIVRHSPTVLKHLCDVKLCDWLAAMQSCSTRQHCLFLLVSLS